MSVALPLRESTEIQGDILAGFRKDQMTLLFLQLGEAMAARAWLERLIPQLATTAQVASFNAEFSEARKASAGDDPKTFKATWLGLSLTYPGVQLLAGQQDVFPKVPAGTTIEAFAQGAADRALALGDIDESDPKAWLFGYDHNRVIHAVLTVAADTEKDLATAVNAQREAATSAGAVVVHQQNAATLPGNRRGKEHFGFKDGVSEPGVEQFDDEDPERPGYTKGKPGTRLIPAGEFIIGHKRVDTGFPRSFPTDDIPTWMVDGSFQVIRRLAQDVPGWWAQVAAELKQLKAAKAVDGNTTTEWLAARLVGRWRSGASIAACPMKPNTTPDALPDNDIHYKGDPDGLVTPLFSHLRKSNPRDGLLNAQGEEVREVFMDARRIIRRGAPYGLPFDPAGDDGGGPDESRGLMFICYQADLVDQFEFIQQAWVDDQDFPHGRAPNQPGPDAMISGRVADLRDGQVSFESTAPSGERMTTKLRLEQFVRTEGAVYTFVPSMSTLRRLAQGRLSGETLPEDGGGTPQPGAQVNAILASPDQQGHYWAFRGDTVQPASGNGVASTPLTPGGSVALSSWPALTEVTHVDTILPIPDRQAVDGSSSYWVFHTSGGRQVFRVISIADREPHTSKLLATDQPLSRWNSFAGVSQVDAFLPIPDLQPDCGMYFYWMFHTTQQGQRYRIIAVTEAGDRGYHPDQQKTTDTRLTAWSSLEDVTRVDACLPIPGKQRVNGQSSCWVFHDSQFRVISIADGGNHADRLVQGDRPIDNEFFAPNGRH